jgi:hypothetical protein
MSISSSSSSYAIASIPTTKGDIVVHNGTSLIRVALGSNGYALTSDSAQISGVSWSVAPSGSTASYTPIAYTTISSNSRSVTISSIPGGYKAIGVIVCAKDTSTERDLFVTFNGSATSYNYGGMYWVSSAGDQTSQGGNPAITFEGACGSDTGVLQYGLFEMLIPAYDSGYVKSGLSVGGGGTNSLGAISTMMHYSWNNTSAITSITWYVRATSIMASDSSFYVYGIS